MNFVKEASKLLTNKYFLYFTVFLAVTNIIGYLVTHKIKAVIFFVLVSLLTNQFSKNMSVVLLVSIITTNFLMSNKQMREGLENETTPALNKIEDKDPQISNIIPFVKESENNEQVNKKINDKSIATANQTMSRKQNLPNKIVDPNNLDKNNDLTNESVEGFGEKMSVKKSSNNNLGSRLDYATTIEQSYANLDNLLGSDSIKQLSTDTQKLMKQQQNLFDTMQNMVPVLQGAQNLLKDFKIDGLTDSLKNISGLANSPIATTNK